MHEDFAFAHHAQFAPGPFLDGAGTVVQVADFGFQRGVARAQAFVFDELLVQPTRSRRSLRSREAPVGTP